MSLPFDFLTVGEHYEKVLVIVNVHVGKHACGVFVRLFKTDSNNECIAFVVYLCEHFALSV